ncbi:uncharacterized protein LOC114255262 [Monomorium pharaonis]|uniref:uncharacterized protein LOC114255262 n=1 Tax=Monomorium pharaonis TaxID=307658 RepID=UPI00102E1C2B|nr:uncharacterized protein LOC114255262 [Monomorium pharaonis]
MGTSNAKRSGRLVEVTTPEIIDKIYDMLDFRRLRLRSYVSAVGISNEQTHNILHQHLSMKKLSTRWVPRLLTIDRKRNRVRYCKDGLQLLQRNSQDLSVVSSL